MKIGDPFDRLTVTALLPNGRAACDCACGNKVEVARGNLTSGNTRSCGCLNRERSRERFKARRAAKRARPLR